jgi:pimeloyl-ACP methyl ester carboxylesterase
VKPPDQVHTEEVTGSNPLAPTILFGRIAGAHHYVFAPTLKDEHSSNLTEHIEQVCTLITKHNLKDIILAGHSYGGMIITGVATKMADRISHLVYVDAALSDPGQSLFDVIVSGGCDSMSFAGLEPAAPYVEKLQFDAQKIRLLPKPIFSARKASLLLLLMSPGKKLPLPEKNGHTLSCRHLTYQWLPCQKNYRNCCWKWLKNSS